MPTPPLTIKQVNADLTARIDHLTTILDQSLAAHEKTVLVVRQLNEELEQLRGQFHRLHDRVANLGRFNFGGMA